MKNILLLVGIAVLGLMCLAGYIADLLNPSQLEWLFAKLHIPIGYDSFLKICQIIGLALLVVLVIIAIKDRKKQHR